MYAVVGCTNCSMLWLIEGSPETTECPRCSRRYRTADLKRFIETADEAQAREARAALLAKRQDEGDRFDAVPSYQELADDLADAGIDDEEYLAGQDVNPDMTAAAGDRATTGEGTSTSNRKTVLAALDALDRPTEADIVEYATARGVSAEYVRTALEKLVRTGEVSVTDGQYRRL